MDVVPFRELLVSQYRLKVTVVCADECSFLGTESLIQPQVGGFAWRRLHLVSLFFLGRGVRARSGVCHHFDDESRIGEGVQTEV